MTPAQTPASMQALGSRPGDRWWLQALRGLFLVVLGLYMLFQPGLSLLAYVVVLGAFLIADGVIAIVAGIAGRSDSRGWTLARGVLMVLVGAAIVWHPLLFGTVAGVTLVIFIAVASIVGGVMEIVVAIRQRKAIEGEGWMIFSGALSVLFGIVLIMAPLVSLALLIALSGAVAVLFGAVVIFSAFRLRRRQSASER